MTKKERTALAQLWKKYEELTAEENRIFNYLQDRNRAVTGTAWCSAEANAEDLTTAGEKNAMGLYMRYVKLGAQIDIMREYGQTLANIDFWKK